MIVLGGRTDIVAQWFTKRFINKRSGLFKEVVIGPGEYAAIIRKGKIEQLITEGDQLKGVSTGLLDKIKTWLGGGDDFQMLVIDVRPKVVAIPFEGYSQDRHKVGGAVNLTFRISPQNALDIINMMAGPTVLDNRWWNREEMSAGAVDPSNYEYSGVNLKELTVEDVAVRFGRDLESNLYSEVISMTDAAAFHKDALSVSQAVLAVVERKRDFWGQYGLEIVDKTCSIGNNALEDVLRRKSQVELEQIGKDVEFFSSIKDLTRAKDLEVQSERLRSETRLSKSLGEIDYRRAMVERQDELDVIIRRQGWEKVNIDVEAQQTIQDVTLGRELEREKMVKAKEAYANSMDLEMMIKATNAQIDLLTRARDTDIDLNKKERDIQISQSQNELEGLQRISERQSEQNIREYQATKLEERRMAAELERARIQKEKEVGLAEAAAKAKEAEARAQVAGIDTYERALNGQRDHEARIADTDVRKIEQMSKISKAPEAVGRNEEKRCCPHCGKVAPSSAQFCPGCGKNM